MKTGPAATRRTSDFIATPHVRNHDFLGHRMRVEISMTLGITGAHCSFTVNAYEADTTCNFIDTGCQF